MGGEALSTRLLGIPDALRAFGIEPVLVAGWQTRGLAFDVKPTIHLRHWTAGSPLGKAGSLSIVTYGRSDLPGPLCQVLQERTGGPGLDRAYVVASGRANHAGTGAWAGITSGNRYGTGNEIEWSGPGEAFSARRKESSERIAAALLSISANPKGAHACEHREYALPEGRKVDTNLSGSEFRRNVQALLTPPAPPPDPTEEDDMPKPMLLRLTPKDPAVLYMSSARTVQHVPNPEALQGFKFDMQNNGMSPDVCVLSATDEGGMLEELHDFVVSLPFLGAFPDPPVGRAKSPTEEAWKGPHYPGN